MNKTIICQRCGEPTPYRGQAQKYCPECAKEIRRGVPHRLKIKKRKSGVGLLQAALEANRLHMSYGEYMRMKEE